MVANLSKNDRAILLPGNLGPLADEPVADSALTMESGAVLQTLTLRGCRTGRDYGLSVTGSCGRMPLLARSWRHRLGSWNARRWLSPAGGQT